MLGVAAFLGPVCHLWTQFGVHGVLGAFLAFQASSVRFRFSDTDLDVVFIEPGADDSTALDVDTESSGDNKLQGGGANKWSFESVTNWEFWFPGFPVLVYYKENQTRPEGQPHFFPIIMDGKKLYETMLAKMPASVNPKPDPSEWNLDTALRRPSSEGRSRKTWTKNKSRRSKRPKASPDSTRSDPGRTRRRGERRGGGAIARRQRSDRRRRESVSGVRVRTPTRARNKKRKSIQKCSRS